MAIDDILNISKKSKEIHSDYKFSDSIFHSMSQDEMQRNGNPAVGDVEQTVSFAQDYSVPLSSIRSQVLGAEQIINTARRGIEDSFLRKIYISPYINNELEEAHFRVWKEACKFLNIPEKASEENVFRTQGLSENIISNENNKTITKDTVPGYICFDEYLFAESYNSTACRRLISEFDRAIAHSTFSYFFQIRKLFKYFLNELFLIKNSLLFDFKETYENESQQKIALRYDTWSKMALHYTRRIAATIVSQPDKIPYAEVDKISKKQAAQFQAFFAIRLNAVESEINDILSILKRDLTEDGDLFYRRYISGALKLHQGITEPFNLDFNTTNFPKEFPFLVSELVLASSVLEGNFAAVHADLIERYESFISKTDTIMSLIHEKRRFSSYISQLADKAVQKKKILETITEDNYGTLFRSIIITNGSQSKYTSSHTSLDGLDSDDHPQYLLRSGGTITGNITLEDGVKIGGVSIPEHQHSGFDGSSRISPNSIDYESLRNSSNRDSYVSKPASVSIDGFVSDIIDGGVPIFDTIINIEIDDVNLDNYEFEIVYTEIE